MKWKHVIIANVVWFGIFMAVTLPEGLCGRIFGLGYGVSRVIERGVVLIGIGLALLGLIKFPNRPLIPIFFLVLYFLVWW